MRGHVPTRSSFDSDERHLTVFLPVSKAAHSWSYDKRRCYTVLIDISNVLLTEGGSTNPSVNDQLNRAMEFGKSKDVPNATMMEAIRKLVCKSWKLI